MISFTVSLIVITSVISFTAFGRVSIYEKGVFSVREIVQNRGYYRLVSSAFLHADWGHLLFNMFSLYSFAVYLEQGYGMAPVALIYFGSVLGGSLFSLFRNRKDMDYRATGASAGVCGIIYASIFLLEGGKIYIFPIPVAIPDYIYAVAFLLITTYAMKSRREDSIGHDAHLGGAVTGTLITLVQRPELIVSEYLLLLFLMLPLAAIPVIERLRKTGK